MKIQNIVEFYNNMKIWLSRHILASESTAFVYSAGTLFKSVSFCFCDLLDNNSLSEQYRPVTVVQYRCSLQDCLEFDKGLTVYLDLNSFWLKVFQSNVRGQKEYIEEYTSGLLTLICCEFMILFGV